MSVVLLNIRKQSATTGYSLQQAGSIISSQINHESAPPINLDIEEIPFQDGAKLVSKTFSPKQLTITGRLKASTQADLDTLIDTFKKNTDVIFGYLDIAYAGGYRRFVVTTASQSITRSGKQLTVCGFGLALNVIDPPFARAVSALDGDLVVNESMTLSAITTAVTQETVTFDGSAEPRPIFNIVIDKPSSLQSIVLKNKNTQQYIEVEGSFASGDLLRIDTEKFQTTLEGNNKEFIGVMPEFELGTNRLEIFAKDLSATSDFNEIYNKVIAIPKGVQRGMFFTTEPSTGNKLGHYEFLMAKNPEATGRMIARLYDDSNGNGVPDNLLQTIYVDFSLIGEGYGWISLDFTDFDGNDLNASSAGYAVVFEPENDNSIIYLPYRDKGIVKSSAYKDKNMSAFAIDADKEHCYRVFFKIGTSQWQLDANSKYTKRYL